MAFLTAVSLKLRAPARPVARCSVRMSDELTPIAPLNADEKVPMKEPYDLKAGRKAPVCRCWQSGKFPLCDGSHNKFNKETGSHVGPLVVAAEKPSE